MIYVAVALGVFGTLTVDEVIDSGGTALAVAAEPVLGRAGYWLMTVTALFATAGATNAGLYPAAGLCETMAASGQFPPALGRRFGGRAPAGILLTAAISIVLAVGFDLSAIASIGSAIALLVFTMVSVGHLRVRRETGASLIVLLIAIASTVVVLVTFAFTTLVEEPATAVTLVAIIVAERRHRPGVEAAPSARRRPPGRGAVDGARWSGPARPDPHPGSEGSEPLTRRPAPCRPGQAHSGSASSTWRALALSSRSLSETVGYSRPSDVIVSTMIVAVIACITCLLSAGRTYHGAHAVEVAVIASS